MEVLCDTPADPAYFATLRATLEIVPRGGRALRTLPLSGLCLTQAPETPDAPRLRTGTVTLSKSFLSNKLHGTLAVTNDGASDLIIYALELPEGVRFDRHARLDRASLTIAPGQSLKLQLSGDAGSQSGMTARLTIFSNDPLRPAKEMTINIQ